MSLDGHRPPVEKLGAYTLGHLADDERAELQAHLDDCPACRTELEEIAPVATLLPKADPDRLGEPPAEPPPHLGQQIYERVEQDRRREYRHRRRREYRRPTPGLGWIAAAAIVLAVLALSTFSLEERGEQVDLRPVSERTALPVAFQNLEATATLKAEGYSTQIELEAWGLTPGQTHAVWLEKADGTRVSAGGFQPFDEGPVTVYLSAALPLDEAVALGLGTPDGETVLRADRQYGDDADLIVPDLQGRTLENAIEVAGPDFEVDAGEDDGDRSEDTIVDQDPAPGERAEKGSTISVTLSSDRREDADLTKLDSKAGDGERTAQDFPTEPGATSEPGDEEGWGALPRVLSPLISSLSPLLGPLSPLIGPALESSFQGTAPPLDIASGIMPLPAVAPTPPVAPTAETPPEGAPPPGPPPAPEEVSDPGATPSLEPTPPPGDEPGRGNGPDPLGDNLGRPKGDPDNPGRPKGDPDNPGRPKGTPANPGGGKGDNPGRPKGDPDNPGRPKGDPDNPGKGHR